MKKAPSWALFCYYEIMTYNYYNITIRHSLMKPLSHYLNAALYDKIINDIVSNNPEITVAGGIMFCAYASKQLQTHFPELEIIIGRHMHDSNKTSIMFSIAKHNFEQILQNDIRYSSAQYFLNHNKHKKDIGHCVCYDGNTIIDLTSQQFGLPRYYELDAFCSYFDKIVRNIEFEMESIADYDSI